MFSFCFRPTLKGWVLITCGFLFLLGFWPPLKVGVLIREGVVRRWRIVLG